MKPLDIILFKGQWYNPMTPFIYARTSTLWTHCAIVDEIKPAVVLEGDIPQTIVTSEAWLIEAHAQGVEKVPWSVYGHRQIKVMRYQHELTQETVERVRSWLDKKVETGTGYDFLAFLGYMTGFRRIQDPDKFTCAELVAWAFQDNGVRIYNDVPAFVYPCEFEQHCDFMEVKEPC